MANDILVKREKVKAAYAGPGWKKKVDAMTDDQVVAIFLRLQRQGKI